MIAKKYRFTERELRKVLSRRKPFFSYMFIANIMNSRESHGRVGILLSSKIARGSVNRNYWRRQFYDISYPYIRDLPVDVVLVPKKWTLLDHKNKTQLAEFEKNIQFLYKKIRSEIASSKNTNPNHHG